MISKTYSNRQPFEIASGIFLLGGSDFFNLYLICGKEKTALIELGVSFIANEVINQIDKLGVEPDFLVLTHPHSDHITGWNTLHKRYPKALLIAGDKVFETINYPKNAKIIFHEDKYLYDKFLASNYHFEGEPINRIIDLKQPIIVSNNITINLGGMLMNCIPVKGHSIGNIIIEIPEEKALIVSDSLGYQAYDKHIPMFLTDFNDYLKTIEIIDNFNPNLIGPAHYGPFLGKEVKTIIEFAKEETVAFFEKIDNKIRYNTISVESVFNYINIGILSKISKKSIEYCAKLLIHNVKNRQQRLNK